MGRPPKSKDSFKVCESNQVIDSSHKLSLSEIRLIAFVLGNTHRTEDIEEDRIFEIRVDDYARFFNIKPETAYEQISRAVNSLTTRQIFITEHGYHRRTPPRNLKPIPWVSSIEYNYGSANATLIWHPDFLPLLNNLGRENTYSSYYLVNIKKLASINSIRLYRLLNRYQNDREVTLFLDELKRLLGFFEGEYKEWSSLDRNVLKKAVAAINSSTELEVTYQGIRYGRGVGKVHFKIDRKELLEPQLEASNTVQL